MAYCNVCGREAVNVLLRRGKGYNTETGKLNPDEYKKACPTNLCGHYGKTHGTSTQSLWQMLFNKYSCLDCGKDYKTRPYDYGGW